MLDAAEVALMREMMKAYQRYGLRVDVVSAPLTIDRPGRMQGQIIGIDSKSFDNFFFAEILGHGGGGSAGSGVDGDHRAYSWVERVQTATGSWVDGSRFGEFDAYVAEPEAGYTGTVATGSMVMMRKSPTVAGTWEFEAPAAEAASGEYPLGDPCLIPLVDEYGAIIGVAGIAQRWGLADGTVECRESGYCDPACGVTEIIGGTSPPPPPAALNTILVNLIMTGGGSLVRTITVGLTDYVTNSSGNILIYVPDGSYTAECQLFVGETATWSLVGADTGSDSGSGATTDSFDTSGGGFVTITFNIVSPPGEG
jgi:hypothetical protein